MWWGDVRRFCVAALHSDRVHDTDNANQNRSHTNLAGRLSFLRN